ncbi:hypothetical protein [Gracilibacillus alcaliphilus]|uniref:hypothetical protein n=1 Tax=Gracilibacillus alcaliphilus TaxID=1401441 RepID=UPI001956410D|nr:hypothetical protein [Gracilibacillus alcaliphilus]MBM7678388.1 hypothetical protein [Gracilibacillus alcaliphilus]
MGYLAKGKIPAYFIRMDDEEYERLYKIFKRTKNRRIKKKIAKRIDSLVKPFTEKEALELLLPAGVNINGKSN